MPLYQKLKDREPSQIHEAASNFCAAFRASAGFMNIHGQPHVMYEDSLVTAVAALQASSTTEQSGMYSQLLLASEPMNQGSTWVLS